jgi:hypothetical protein
MRADRHIRPYGGAGGVEPVEDRGDKETRRQGNTGTRRAARQATEGDDVRG